MKPIRKPIVDQPIEENLRRVYGAHDAGGPVAAHLPAQLADLLEQLAERHGRRSPEDGRR